MVPDILQKSSKMVVCVYAAMALLVVHQEEHAAYKNSVMRCCGSCLDDLCMVQLPLPLHYHLFFFEIHWKECLQSDLSCVGRDVKL